MRTFQSALAQPLQIPPGTVMLSAAKHLRLLFETSALAVNRQQPARNQNQLEEATKDLNSLGGFFKENGSAD
jgi:hypothetical protein